MKFRLVFLTMVVLFAMQTGAAIGRKPASEPEPEPVQEQEREQEKVYGLTNKACALDNGVPLDAGTYVRVLTRDAASDSCTVQWYEGTANISKSDVYIFTVTDEQETKILTSRTAGIITG